jgi:outer membrane protein
MKLLYKLASTAALLASLTSGAMAQDSKIGYINTQRITTESAIAKAAQAKLEQEFSKRGKELADLQVALKTFSEKFERDAPTLTESQRASRQKEGAAIFSASSVNTRKT